MNKASQITSKRSGRLWIPKKRKPQSINGTPLTGKRPTKESISFKPGLPRQHRVTNNNVAANGILGELTA